VEPKILYFQGWRLIPLRVWSLNTYVLVPPFLPIMENPLKYNYWNCQQLLGYFVLRCFHIIQYFEYQNLANAVFQLFVTLFYRLVYVHQCTCCHISWEWHPIVTAFRTSYSTRLSKGTKKNSQESHLVSTQTVTVEYSLLVWTERAGTRSWHMCLFYSCLHTQEVKTCHKLV